MTKDLSNILKILTSVVAPSTKEQNVQKQYKRLISPFVDNIYEDVLGNSIAIKQGQSDVKLMLIAHADEIGFFINYISDDGYLGFTKIGGVDETILQGQRVIIKHSETDIIGIIGKYSSNENRDRCGAIKCEQLWIDIGASTRSDASKKISIGDYVTFVPNYTNLDNNLVVSKSLDNRSGLTILCYIAEKLHNIDIEPTIYYVSSVQEEIGSRGAVTTSFNIEPDICITLDVTYASDYPSINPRKYGDIKLSNGPVISLGADVNNTLQNEIIQIAKNGNIPYQISVNGHNSCTDANKVQISRIGIHSGLISIPCRYIHSPTEVVSLTDIDNAVALLKEFVTSYKKWQKIARPL